MECAVERASLVENEVQNMNFLPQFRAVNVIAEFSISPSISCIVRRVFANLSASTWHENVCSLNNIKELSHTSTLQISNCGRTAEVKCRVRDEIIWGDLNQILLLKLTVLLSIAFHWKLGGNSWFFFPIFFPAGNFSPAPVPRANGLCCFSETENEAKSSLHLTINRLKWNFTLDELLAYGSCMENSIWESFLLFHHLLSEFYLGVTRLKASTWTFLAVSPDL